MNIESGVVQRITEKDGMYGKMYSMQVNGQWYGIGKYPPKCSEGDNVEFQWVPKGNFRNADPKTVTRSSAPVTSQPQQSGGNTGYVDRQGIISKQWAVNAGVQWVTTLVNAEALPNLKKTANASEKYDYLNGLLMEKTSEFLFIATGQTLGEEMVKQSLTKDSAAEHPSDDAWPQ